MRSVQVMATLMLVFVAVGCREQESTHPTPVTTAPVSATRTAETVDTTSTQVETTAVDDLPVIDTGAQRPSPAAVSARSAAPSEHKNTASADPAPNAVPARMNRDNESARRIPDPHVRRGVWLNSVVAEDHRRLEAALENASINFTWDRSSSSQGPAQVVITIGTSVPLDQLKGVVTALKVVQDEYDIGLMIGSGDFEWNQVIYVGTEAFDKRQVVPLPRLIPFLYEAQSTEQILEAIASVVRKPGA